MLLAGAPAGIERAGAQSESATPEMTPPRIIAATVDWDAARADIAALPSDAAGDAADASLDRLNAAAGRTFAGIERSSVPVLLPLASDALLQGDGAIDGAGFRPHFFQAGPTGYDAAFTLSSAAAADISNFESKEEPLILITASAIHYDIGPPAAEAPRSSKELQDLVPGIRRRWLESYLRYSFERYGVTYTASMLCYEGRPRRHWVSCADAANVIVRLIKSLRLVGGTPQSVVAEADPIERPPAQDAEFTFAPPGKLLPNTGLRGHDGKRDTTVYGRIRFPLAQAPAYANSQSFMHWGNCDFTGRTRSGLSKGASYRCRVNSKPLVFDESAAENRSYPWRDNFCEHRGYFVGQCGAGRGHQGQDIRPATCDLRNHASDRCSPFRDEIVAVRDGTLLRIPRRESVYLFVNAPGERLRVRYLHMHPKMLDGDGIVSGRVVREGEVLGKVGNYDRIPNGTTYHLHFELQVPTRDGWVFVNPYMTLVASYERLIGGRGRMVDDEETIAAAPPVEAPSAGVVAEAAPADVALTTPLPPVRPVVSDDRAATRAIAESDRRKAKRLASTKATASKGKTGDRSRKGKSKSASSTGDCKAKLSHGRSQRGCAARLSKPRTGAKSGVRKVGRSAPSKSSRARRVGANVHTSDARPEAGYLGVRVSQ